MKKIWGTKNGLAVALGVSALMASFALALAATVQTIVEVPATANLVQAQVLTGDGLYISYDDQGNDPVNTLSFEIVELQPPLESRLESFQRIFLRNDSDINLTIISPCGNAIDDASGSRIGFVHMWRDGTETNEGSCDWQQVWNIEPGEIAPGMVNLNVDDGTEVGLGSYSFTIVIGAVGEE